MQRTMQRYAPVYRDQETMDKGIEIMKGFTMTLAISSCLILRLFGILT